jgi:hypothetical protein
VVGKELGAAVAELPAMGGSVIDALDALGHLECLPAEDRDLADFHGIPLKLDGVSP